MKGGGPVRTSLTGVQVGVDVTGSEKVWRTFQAIGDIAFAYAYSNVLIEIQACHFSPPSNYHRDHYHFYISHRILSLNGHAYLYTKAGCLPDRKAQQSTVLFRSRARIEF